MISITEFCDRFDACDGGRGWAIENCKDMQEVWDTIKPNWLVWIATRKGVIDDRTLRLFACWSVRQVWHLLTDERSRNAVEVAERFTNGEVTADELEAAWEAARNAAWAARSAASAAAWAARSAASAAAWAAAWDAAGEAAWDAAWAARSAASAAAWDAARDAARDAASEAARDAASEAARDAAWAAAREKQAEWLRANAKPNFELEVME